MGGNCRTSPASEGPVYEVPAGVSNEIAANSGLKSTSQSFGRAPVRDREAAAHVLCAAAFLAVGCVTKAALGPGRLARLGCADEWGSEGCAGAMAARGGRGKPPVGIEPTTYALQKRCSAN